MIYTIFDIETDGLLEEVSKIHCLSYCQLKEGKIINKGSLTNQEEIKEFITNQQLLIGHNIILYDIPVLEKLLNINLSKTERIDTLYLSWYLYNLENKHGLEYWGNVLNIPKPIINDWQNLSITDYINRCETDVRINTTLFIQQWKYLNIIYNSNHKAIWKLLRYYNFKR